MLSIFVVVLGLSLAFFGLGQLLWWGSRRVMGGPSAREPLWGELGFLGLFGFGIAAVLWNFLLPMTTALAWPLLTLGLAALVVASVHRIELRRSLAAIAAPAAVSAAALAVLVAFTPLGYDAGLYHLPAQLWARSGPTAIGLANFHDRLGLNSILEPISAAIWLRGNLILVGVIDVLFLFFYLLSIVQFLREQGGRDMPVSVAFAVLSPLSLLLFNRYFIFQVGVDDVPAAMVTLTCVFAFIRALENRDRPNDALIALSTLALLSTFAITVKLSSLQVALLPGIALAAFIRRGIASRRQAAALCAASGALALPVIARGVLLSGCLLFPLTGSCLDFLPWTDRGVAEEITAAITAYARTREAGVEHAAGWAWLPEWWQRWRPMLGRITIVTTVVSVVAWGLRSVLRRLAPSPAAHASSAEREWISSGIVLFCVASITLWFLLAPDPRFGGAALHVLTITPGLLMFASQAEKLRLEPKVWRVITISGIALALLTSFEIATRSWPLSGDRDNFFSVRLGTPTVEVVPLQHFGVRPQVGDQCWLTRSPCSPYERKISVRNRGRWLMIEPLYRSE